MEIQPTQINSRCKYKVYLETKRFDGPIFQIKESWSMPNCQNGTA